MAANRRGPAIFFALAPAIFAFGCHRSAARVGDPPPAGHRFHRIDVHTHIAPDGIERAIRLMNEWGIDGMVNLSGMHPGPPHNALERQMAAARESGGRIAVFTTPDFKLVRRVPNYGAAMADQLTEAHRLGAIGLKITKGLGLGYPGPDGVHLLAVDDPGLDPMFERAGELGMPVAIHCGDPKAFWQPATPANERWDELQAHPEWSFYGSGAPSWQELYDAFERRVARHPKTTFIAVHFGDDPEDPDNVARMLDKYPNFYLDTAGQDAALLHQVPGPHPVRDRHRHRRRPGRHDVRLERRHAPDPRGRGSVLHRDLAVFPDARPSDRQPHPHPGALEDRRRGPAGGDLAQGLLRQRRPRSALASTRRLTGEGRSS
jgi:predicted TIM-barrel fold metal-dependent hydrolase